MIYIRRCRFDRQKFEICRRTREGRRWRDTLMVRRAMNLDAAMKLCRRMKGEA